MTSPQRERLTCNLPRRPRARVPRQSDARLRVMAQSLRSGPAQDERSIARARERSHIGSWHVSRARAACYADFSAQLQNANPHDVGNG